MSMSASGTVGDAITFATWKGRPYVRERVIPNNPKSAKQTGIRVMLRFASKLWKAASAPDKALWVDEGTSREISPFNAFLSAQMNEWLLTKAPAMDLIPARSVACATPASAVATAGTKSITVACVMGSCATNVGFILCMSTVTGFTPSRLNAVKIDFAANGATVNVPITPLTAGDYFFRLAAFNEDGTLSAFLAQTTATVA
jgi:hypothetical protein